MANKDAPIHVVAMPYPGRGHINPMLTLSRLLAARDLLITFVITEEWLSILTSSPLHLPPNLHLKTIPNVIPSEVGRANDFSGFLDAVWTNMEKPFEGLLDRLDPPVTGIVADTYMPWVVGVGARRGVPVHSLFTMSAAFFSVLYHFEWFSGMGDRQLPVNLLEKQEGPLQQQFPGLTSIQKADIQPILSSERPLKKALESISWVGKAKSLLFTSFNELESAVIDTLRAELPCPVYPIGPCIPYTMLQDNSTSGTKMDSCLNWLESQPKKSVLYISLGSFLSVSGPQMVEIAMGLRASGTRFLWVAREKSSEMQEMSGNMGLVVPWCEQLRVLNHPSIGGFLSHCGWNSMLEGVFSGVPILTFPIFWDQPVDSRLIVDEWKVGLSVREEAGKKEFVTREEIAEIVVRFLDLEGGESKEMRRRAAELQESSRKTIQEGGSSHANMDSFVREIMQGLGCQVSSS